MGTSMIATRAHPRARHPVAVPSRDGRAPLRGVLGLASFLAILIATTPARGDDCYRVRRGTQLFAESMLQTAVATLPDDVVGRFMVREHDVPGVSLYFEEPDGSAGVIAYANEGDAAPVACPTRTWRWSPGLRELTWPDGRAAGTVQPDAPDLAAADVEVARGRACFMLASVGARVCAPVSTASGCLAVRRGAPVFAHARNSARLGTTTARVYARSPVKLDKFLSVRMFDRDDQTLRVFVRTRDARATKCPNTTGNVTFDSVPPYEARLPDGTDAGYRIGSTMSLTPDKEVRVGSERLLCRNDVPLHGLRTWVCRHVSP